MKNRVLWIKILLCVFPFIGITAVWVLKDELYFLGTTFPRCPSYSLFGIYCPGCGNTRSVQHLLKGDILGSIRFNIVPVLGIIFGALAYFELVTYVFGKHKKLLPRGRVFWITFIIVMSIYFILRNFIRLF